MYSIMYTSTCDAKGEANSKNNKKRVDSINHSNKYRYKLANDE